MSIFRLFPALALLALSGCQHAAPPASADLADMTARCRSTTNARSA